MPAMADADLLLETFGLGLYRQKWLFAKGHTKNKKNRMVTRAKFYFLFLDLELRTRELIQQSPAGRAAASVGRSCTSRDSRGSENAKHTLECLVRR